MAIPIPVADLAAMLVRIPDTPMGAAGLRPELARGRTERGFPIAGGAGGAPALSARAASEVALFAFNSADDADADGVLRPAGGADGLPPLLAPAPDRAWLKTRLELEAGAAASGELRDVTLQLESGARLTLADYRVFPREASARAAAASVLAGSRFAVRLDDVLELAPGDALSLQLAGALSASVSVRWADVFSSQVSLLRQFVPEGEILPVRIGAAAELSATVRLRDEFLLVFTCEQAGSRYGVSLRKARARGVGGAARLDVEVEPQSPEQVERAVSAVVESLLGAAEERVRAAVRRALGGAADAADSALVEALRARLGVPDAAALSARLDELRRRLAETVLRLARQKVEVGFRYEYQRVEQDAAVLAVVMEREALREHHAALVAARFGPVLDAVRRRDPRLALRSFLGQRELQASRAWGFALSFGRWQAGGTDREEVRAVEQRDAAGRKRVAYLGQRSYRGSWGGEEFEWAGDLAASMERFSQGPVPLVSDYRFGLHLLWRSGAAELSERSVRELLDTALLWEVFPQHALRGVEERLRPALGRRAELVTQLRLDEEALRAALRAPRLGDPLALAEPLAAAMPWLPGEAGREDVVVRRSLYAPLWAEYLRSASPRPAALARAAEDHLRRGGHPALANRERGFSASRAHTFAGLVELNPGTREAWQRFREGLTRLRDATARPTPDDGVVAAVFRSLSGLWKQSHHVRASGALLLDLARGAGATEGVERTLTVTWGEETLVIGS